MFGKIFSYPVDASIYAQPLYMPSVNIPGKGVHNVVYVATMNDSVYAFDADSNAGLSASPLWQVNFTDPVAGITAVPGTDIQTAPNVSGPVGIMGTPVIDQSSGSMYLVARTKENGSYVQRLHALDITSGAEKFGGPVVIQGAVAGTGYDSSSGTVTFNPMTANQRPALALTNGRIVVAWGGLDDDFDPYHGWVMVFEAATLRQLSIYNTTPNGSRGGIWQSGTGIPIDAGGSVYLATGNGAWDGVTNFGDTIFKLNPANGFSQTDWFTPDNQAYLDANDLDLGVSGPVLIPNTNLLLSGSKQGILYLLNTNNMGHQVNGNGQIVQSFQAANGHIHGDPVYYTSPTLGPLFYIWGEGDYLKAFHFDGSTLSTTPVMQSSFQDAAGMPGGILALSANGSQPGTGILWASLPLNADAELQVVSGVLRAFDASNLSSELWDSTQNSTRDSVGNFGKFCPPTVANGKVYLSTFSNVLDVYGLIGTTPDFTINATPGSQTVGLNSRSVYTISVSDMNRLSAAVRFTISGLPTGASASFNPGTISGNGSATLSITIGAATALGTYLLTLTGTSGALTHSIFLGLTVTTAAGTLSGSLSTPAGTQNLTALGSSDWAHWGLTSAASFDDKATGGGLISTYAVVGAGTVLNYTNNPVGFTWTDGTPTTSATNSSTGIYIAGVGNGFQITAPADTTQRTLAVYVGVWRSQGKMVAHLSDGSAADYVDTSLNNATSTTPGLYTFNYQAVSSGQTLTVTFTQINDTSGNVTLQGATVAQP
jgi:hypothetical protein